MTYSLIMIFVYLVLIWNMIRHLINGRLFSAIGHLIILIILTVAFFLGVTSM